jgi:type IV fimbrial biogenesis protein FimT
MNRHLSPVSSTPPWLRGALRLRKQGFTLIELLVVIAIAAIAATLAAPSLSKMLASNRVQTEASSFAGDLMLARTEAVKQGQGVSLCASSDGKTCLGTNTWQKGWIVFGDPSQCATIPTTITTQIRIRAAFKGSDTFVATAPATNSCISFNREGFTSNLSTAKVYFTLHTSDSATLATRCVLVVLGGRITTQTTSTDTSCI